MGTIEGRSDDDRTVRLVGTPYAFKFAWAPLVDQLPLPLLDRWLGRRRGWMLLAQVGILLSTVLLAWSDPVDSAVVTPSPPCSIAFFSATQDIAIDAYRIEILHDEEQGAGSATTQLGYRIALWIVDAMALLLPSLLPWPSC
jgi:PAT family beta-lactamase induction signal transducer AmpG